MKRSCKILLIVGILLYLLGGGYLVFTQTPAADGSSRQRRLVLIVPTGSKTSPIYREAIQEFEQENPDISVKLLETAGNYYQKVTVMIAGGLAPDLMWMGQSFNEFADRDIFLDLSERIQHELDLTDYPPKILELYRRGGQQFGVPFGIDAAFLVYNRRLLRQAGLPDPPEDWDYPQFLAYLRKLSRPAEPGSPRRYGLDTNLPCEVFGARNFDPVTGWADCDSPEMLHYFKTNLALMKEGLIPAAADNSVLSGDAISLFRQERTAMMLSFTMRWDRLFEQLGDMDWGFALLPRVKVQAHWASSQAICIFRGTREPEAAWKLCKFLLRKKFQMAMGCRMFPARKSFSARFIDEAGHEKNNFQILHKVLAHLAPTPRVENLQELMAVYYRYRNEVFIGELSPEEGMRQCAAETNRRIRINRQRRGAK